MKSNLPFARKRRRSHHDGFDFLEKLFLQKRRNVNRRSAQKHSSAASLQPVNVIFLGLRADKIQIETRLANRAGQDSIRLRSFSRRKRQSRFQSFERVVEREIRFAERRRLRFRRFAFAAQTSPATSGKRPSWLRPCVNRTQNWSARPMIFAREFR